MKGTEGNWREKKGDEGNWRDIEGKIQENEGKLMGKSVVQDLYLYQKGDFEKSLSQKKYNKIKGV